MSCTSIFPLLPVKNEACHQQLMIPRARPAFIVGFWALATAAFANTGYLSMRTLAQINDCLSEHNVDSIAEVGPAVQISFLLISAFLSEIFLPS